MYTCIYIYTYIQTSVNVQSRRDVSCHARECIMAHMGMRHGANLSWHTCARAMKPM